jgi:rhomboid family GlyGly-CTERM serine protease
VRVPAVPTGYRGWWLPVAVVIASLAAESGGEPVRTVLRYGRAPIADGEWWRLLSGHLVHLGWSHFLMNAIALLLIWALVGSCLRMRQWLLVVPAVIAVIDLGFWFLDTRLYWYVGLSGLLHGMLAAGLVAGLVTGFGSARLEMSVLGALLSMKLVYEQLFGALPGSEASAGGAVVVNAHLYGAVAGAGLVLLLRVSPGWRRPLSPL